MSDPYQLSAGISCSSCLSGADPGGCFSIRSAEKICSPTPQSPYLFLIGIDIASLLMKNIALLQSDVFVGFLKHAIQTHCIRFGFDEMSHNYTNSIIYIIYCNRLIIINFIWCGGLTVIFELNSVEFTVIY